MAQGFGLTRFLVYTTRTSAERRLQTGTSTHV